MKTACCILLVAALVTGPGVAGTNDDIMCHADTTLSFTSGLGNPSGPNFLDFPTDGTATVELIWFRANMTARNAANIKSRQIIFLRAYTPPRSEFWTVGPDSALVDMVSASEMLVVR